jgi:hypothetical protein
LRIDLRFRHQAAWWEAHGQDPCSSLKNPVAYHNWFALPERPVSDARAPFVLPESFFHVSVPNIYYTSSSTYLIIFLKVISKVLFFNITQKFTNLLVQLSIFLIDLFVGTYRLSSHARLEALVIQTKLN